MAPMAATLAYMRGWYGGERPSPRLHEAIDTCGSVNLAANEAGISRKAAWGKLETLNNLSTLPPVIRQFRGGTVAAINSGESVRLIEHASGGETTAIF
jgi:molybdate transport system regulatory protein